MKFDWAQTLRTAEKHLSRGKIKAAIEEYRKLVEWDPTDLGMLNTLGDAYLRAGLNDSAKQIFSQIAQAYRHQDFTSKAIAVLKKLIRIDPSDLDAAAGLADCYAAQGLRGDAGRQYADVADAYKRAGRDDKALDAYQRMADIDPSNTSMLMMLGDRWIREGLPQRAHASFTAAGDEYSRQGDEQQALAAYLKAQAVLPDEHKLLAAIAEICSARGEAEIAISLLCDSVSRNPGDAELHRILGAAYLSAGLLDDAERTFMKLLALDGREYPNLLIVGERFLEKGDLARAAAVIDEFIDELIANRSEQGAVDFLHKILECDPEHSASLKRLAQISRRLREDFNLVPILKTLAKGALRQGDHQQAVESLQELCSLEPSEDRHREALKSLGVDPPATSFAVGSPDTSPKHRLPNCASQRTAQLARQQMYETEVLLELETEAGFQFPPIDHKGSRWAAVANEFISAGGIDELPTLLNHNTSTLRHSSETITEFELLAPDNRRRSPRVSARVPLVVISDEGGWREFTETVDVSDSGLTLKLAHPIPPMTVLQVSFEMTKWPETLTSVPAMNTSQGIVRHCRTRPGQPNLVGVELTSTQP